ncbi:MAG: protocatechuate 3,4-dioxygenase [Pseudomonadota bacterium]
MIPRRTFLRTLAAVGGALALPATLLPATVQRAWAARQRTPTSTEGPFYPTPSMRFADVDNDLVKVKGVVERAGGEVVRLRGRVIDAAGQPVAGARVEIWQCDGNGRYLHADEAGKAGHDPGFQGFGYVVTGDDGVYAFRTIKPVPYPGRTPHIHVKVLHGGRELTSQFYTAGDRRNARDFLFRSMTRAQQNSVLMAFKSLQGETEPTAIVDIVV